MKIRLSIDDGCALDTRIAEIAEKHNVECIFYWPVEWHSLAHYKGYEPLTFDDATKIASKHEVGSHTITHRHLTQIPEWEAKQEIQESKGILQRLFGKKVTKFAPPRGYTNDLLTEFTERFYEKQRLTKGENLVHIHPNSGANENLNWVDAFNEKKEAGIEIIELWGHSHEFEKFGLWKDIEGFFESLHSRT